MNGVKTKVDSDIQVYIETDPEGKFMVNGNN